jgi:hypothetical protein
MGGEGDLDYRMRHFSNLFGYGSFILEMFNFVDFAKLNHQKVF